MKYEWDEGMNMLKLDRVLHGAAFYPHDYGFIPQTLCGDGDPLASARETRTGSFLRGGEREAHAPLVVRHVTPTLLFLGSHLS